MKQILTILMMVLFLMPGVLATKPMVEYDWNQNNGQDNGEACIKNTDMHSCLEDSKCYWDQETDSCYTYWTNRQKCSDPDKGKNTYVQAHTFGFRSVYADEQDKRIRTGGKDACLSETKLVEHYCDEDGFIQTTYVECENGCYEGRCIIGEVEQPPQPLKCGVKDFQVSNKCIDDGQIEGYRNSYWKCSNGKESYEGGPTSCKTEETWREYAEKFCERSCATEENPPVEIWVEPACPIPGDALRKCPDGTIIPYTSECRMIPPPPPQKPQIDVVFLIDSTGSMDDEIRTVKTHIINIVNDVRRGQPSPDLRVGIVTYRDYEPEEHEYLFRRYDLTRDIDEALSNLKRIEAAGGGDHPEAVETGLHVAINNMDWNRKAKKLIFLVGDAAPHGYGAGDHSFHQGNPDGYNYKELIEDAREEGIVIYTVSGSGMDPAGIRIWKDIARNTGGEYTHLSYERRVVEEYYEEEEEISDEWIPVAKESADYDRETNTILTNTLGKFTKSRIMAEAASIGVEYEEEEVEVDEEDDASKEEEEGSWLDAEDITGREESKETVKIIKNKEPKSIFYRAFSKITFWRS